MYYLMRLDRFPLIRQFYSVTRNTVWHIADKDHILIFVREGICSISYSNKEYTLQAGDIFFIPKNHSYTRRSINNTMCTMTYIHFSLPTEVEQLDSSDLRGIVTDAIRVLDNQFINDTPTQSDITYIYLRNKFSLNSPNDLFHQLDKIKLFSTKRQLMCGFQSSIILCSILSSLSQDTIDLVSTDKILNTPVTVPTNLKKAIRYIRSNYTKKISLDELAAHCNVSKQQLIRYFHSAFQTTPVAYITDYKIARAKDLLFNQPQLTIKEISDELGFNNQHYFTKVFIKSTGESPSEYRHRIFNYLANEEKMSKVPHN